MYSIALNGARSSALGLS